MLKMIKNLNKKDYSLILFSFIFIIAQVWLDLKLPDFMAEITKLVQTPGSQMRDILIQGSYMLACALGSLFSAFVVGYCAAHVGSSFGKTLRKKIFDKTLDFNMEEIKKFSTSSLITRNTNDVTQVQTFIIMGMQVLIKAPIMAVWAISKIANKGFEFSIITAIGVSVVLFTIFSLIIFVFPKFKRIQILTDNLNRITRENLNGIRVIRAFNAEDFQTGRFEKANLELTNTHLFIQKSMSIMGPMMTLVMTGISLAIYWVGAYLINGADMMEKLELFGNMVVFSSYAIQVIMSFMMLVLIFVIYPRASVSAKRINEILDTDIQIKDGETKQTSKDLEGVVEFKNVSFQYPDAEEPIIHNISFKANKGETVAFIGSTGSGKSTLINLIPRFYDATEGEVLVDGINVKDMTLEALYNKIGYIPQKAVMFKGTVNNNISFGTTSNGKPNHATIKKAIEIAQGKEFVEKMSKKYNSEISQGGTNISGGQKQRLSIARAIARNPEIYIFDDTFSALDYKTDFELRKALKQHTNNSTIFIVAQRIGTIKESDKIVVLDEGKCVGIGTHSELLNTCEVYRQIASSQLSKEELANE
ncbi:MAG: ABC transporter ATP-binding protein [Clostridia bacterium]|nr:ABC transporter ATP-binding protein [Clostridia bacterium]